MVLWIAFFPWSVVLIFATLTNKALRAYIDHKASRSRT
jgi:hypothetical protein